MNPIQSKQIVRRTIVAALGLFLCGIGIGFFLFANLGVDPASVFELGLGRVLGISYGDSAALINVVILAIVFFVDRKYINISSLLAIFLLGYTGQFTAKLLAGILSGELWVGLRLLMLVIGVVIIGFGIPIYIRANLGVGAIDLVSEIISDKSGLNYRWVRIAGDVTFVVVGYLLGGKVGIGTVVAAFMLGPVVSFFRPKVNDVIDRFIVYDNKEKEVSHG